MIMIFDCTVNIAKTKALNVIMHGCFCKAVAMYIVWLCFAMHSIVENFKSQNTAQKSLPPRESASRTSVKNI